MKVRARGVQGKSKLKLQATATASEGTHDVRLFCPYWVVNRTSLPLLLADPDRYV